MADTPRQTVRLARTERQDYEAGLERATADRPKTAEEQEKARRDEIVETALERFALVNEAESSQRDREVEDLQFDRGFVEDQWPSAMLKARQGGIAPDGSTIPARPCLVINKLDVPVQQVINEARKARLAVTIKPKGERSSKDGAALRQGMYRAIENDSRANIARIWALERAAKCGRGVYRILTEYANDGDFDLDIVISRIKNQGAVYLDPFAQEPDWSDGEYAFIVQDIPIDEYRRRFRDSDLSTASAEQLQSVSDHSPGWVSTGEGKTTAIRVAEYFYVVWEQRVLVQNPVTGQNELLERDAVPDEGGTVRRTVPVRQVKWCVINAVEILDEEDWPGRYIPLVPVVGKEYVVDGDSCFKGIISNGKDAQRLYNYARSSQALRSGLEALAPWVMAEGQDEGYETMWDEANTRAFTRLKYKPTTYEGHLLPPPQRNDLQSTNLTASMMMAREADGDIQATTGRYNPSLGKQDSTVRSGKAINALKQQGESASSNYLDNLANISLVHEARIILDLLPKVYDRPGRIVRLLGDDPKDERQVMLNTPFVPGPDGRPVRTAPDTPGLIPALMQRMRVGKPPEKAKTYTLDPTEDYMVAVSVGQSYASQKDANAALLGQAMQANPNIVPMLIDIWADQLDNPMGDRIKKRMQQFNPQLKDEDEAEGPQIPPQVQQQMQQMQQQMQQLQQSLQQAQQTIQADTIKAKAQIEMKRMELASRERIEAAKIQAGLAETQAELGSKESIAQLHADAKRAEQALDQAHDDQMADLAERRAERAAVRDDTREHRRALRDATLDDSRAVRDAALAPPSSTAPPREFIPPESL